MTVPPPAPDRDESAEGPAFVPIERAETLVRCNRCGAVCEGDSFGQTQHNVWHRHLDQQIADARRWRPAPRIGGR